MNIGLFASNDVGLEIATFLAARNERLACLALDSNDTGGKNQFIINKLKDIDIFYSDHLSKKDVLRRLGGLDLDLIVLAWWPYILKPQVIKLAKMGCINFHNSYLPYNRGKHPNFWSIVEETPYGVTIHWVDPGIDTGDIIFQREVEKTWEDNGKTLHQKGKAALIELFKERFDDLKAGNYSRLPQNREEGTFHRGAELEEKSRIDLDRVYTARELLNILRARTYPPYQAAWFIDREQRYEVRVEIRKASE